MNIERLVPLFDDAALIGMNMHRQQDKESFKKGFKKTSGVNVKMMRDIVENGFGFRHLNIKGKAKVIGGVTAATGLGAGMGALGEAISDDKKKDYGMAATGAGLVYGVLAAMAVRGALSSISGQIKPYVKKVVNVFDDYGTNIKDYNTKNKTIADQLDKIIQNSEFKQDILKYKNQIIGNSKKENLGRMLSPKDSLEVSLSGSPNNAQSAYRTMSETLDTIRSLPIDLKASIRPVVENPRGYIPKSYNPTPYVDDITSSGVWGSAGNRVKETYSDQDKARRLWDALQRAGGGFAKPVKDEISALGKAKQKFKEYYERNKSDWSSENFDDFFGNWNKKKSEEKSWFRSSYSGDVDSSLAQFGVSKNSLRTQRDVASAYKKASLANHPDRGGNPEKMKDINSAMDSVRKSSWFQNLPKE